MLCWQTLSKSLRRSKPSLSCTSTINSRALVTGRRKRQFVGKLPEQNVPASVASSFGKMHEAYQHGEKNMEDYLAKTSLSPWVPLPDVAARKIFDLTHAQPHDVHVDLGSGDGRINFYAIDVGGVQRSLGVDVDENIVNVARERLAKRHPLPKHLEFVVADLMDEQHPVWRHETMKDATIITMHFAEEALLKFRPLLERKLAGRDHNIQIVTCGYEMPGWESTIQEVVLGTQLNLYRWGRSGSLTEDDLVVGEDILLEKPRSLATHNAFSSEKINGANVIDHTGAHPIRGFNPKILEEDDDDDDKYWALQDDDAAEQSKDAETPSSKE